MAFFAHLRSADGEAVVFDDDVERLVKVHRAEWREEEIEGIGIGIQSKLFKGILFYCGFELIELLGPQKSQRAVHEVLKPFDTRHVLVVAVSVLDLHRLGRIVQPFVDTVEDAP
jgi:hypothetical protein